MDDGERQGIGWTEGRQKADRRFGSHSCRVWRRIAEMARPSPQAGASPLDARALRGARKRHVACRDTVLSAF
jgi:hypothetical protein